MKEFDLNMQKALKVVNPIMAIDFVLLAITALSDDIIPKDIYKIIHPIFRYTFLACVLSHVYLNWTWIKNNFFKKNSAQK